jgi:hypothetical protein
VIGSVDGESSVSEDDDDDAALDDFQRSPRKSTPRASHEFRKPQSAVIKVLQKPRHLCAYKLQLVEVLESGDHPRPASFATEVLQRIDEDNDYLTRVFL